MQRLIGNDLQFNNTTDNREKEIKEKNRSELKNITFAMRNAVRLFLPDKRESGVNPEQYPLL
jgi:hypothetical protein